MTVSAGRGQSGSWLTRPGELRHLRHLQQPPARFRLDVDKYDPISVRILDRQHVPLLFDLQILFLKLGSRMPEAGNGEEQLKHIRRYFHHLVRCARQQEWYKPGLKGMARFVKAEALLIEGSCCDRILHAQADTNDFLRDAVFAQVQALIFSVQGAWHVLGIFDVLLLRANHGEEQVARTGTLDRGGSEAAPKVGAVQRLEVGGLETDVHEADGLRRVLLWIELNKLTVIYFEE